MIKKAILGAALATAIISSPATAQIIFSNSPNGSGGDCSFSTVCASEAGRGNDFALQQFVAPSNVTAEAGSFDTYENGGGSVSANYAIYADAGGTPGALLYSGSGAITQQLVGSGFGLGLYQDNFNLAGGAALTGGGTYYLAVQDDANTFATYLAYAGGAGAFETMDGGATFTSGYEGATAVAVGLYSTPFGAAVPEPATWAMMLVGMGAIGFAMRRRATASVSHA